MISHNERPLTNETIFDLGLPVNQSNDLNAQGTDISNDVLSDPRASRSPNNLDVTIVNDSSSLHVVGGSEFKQTEQDSILMKQADEGSIAVVDDPLHNTWFEGWFIPPSFLDMLFVAEVVHRWKLQNLSV